MGKGKGERGKRRNGEGEKRCGERCETFSRIGKVWTRTAATSLLPLSFSSTSTGVVLEDYSPSKAVLNVNAPFTSPFHKAPNFRSRPSVESASLHDRLSSQGFGRIGKNDGLLISGAFKNFLENRIITGARAASGFGKRWDAF